MIIRVKEKKPGGAGSFAEILKKLSEGESRASDMRPLWPSVADELKQVFRYEFSDANPAGWAAISEEYKDWKIKHGYPATIGIMTIALKKSFTDQAIIRPEKKKLVYRYNENIVNPHSKKKVGTYAKHFDAHRPIIDYAKRQIRAWLKEAVARKLQEGFDWK